MSLIPRVAKACGEWLERTGRKLSQVHSAAGPDPSSTDWFLNETYDALNEARLSHLTTLGLDIRGQTVLEVGAGAGLLTKFFEDRQCKVLSTDGRKDNVEAMRKRFPHRDIRILNLLDYKAYLDLGSFDIVFCYGTLYHTPQPAEILSALSKICRQMILLETCVTPGSHLDVHLLRESSTIDQAIGTIGCRPTRPWITQKLKEYYGYSYVSKTQPHHPDFDLDWDIPLKKLNHRAIFVGSKIPLQNQLLLQELPSVQEYC